MKKVTKIILLGDSDVGKSSIVCRFNDNTFNKENDTLIGSSFISKKVHYNEKQYLIQLWNFRLCERIKEIPKYFYNGIDGLFFVFDITNRNTFTWIFKIIENMEEFYKEKKYPPIYLIGNKCDLDMKREVSKEEALSVRNHYVYKYFECSALTGKNINELIHSMLREIINEIECIEEKNKKLEIKESTTLCYLF